MPSRLALHFLGSPQIFHDESPIRIKRHKSLALLAYLAVERGPHRRESLSALLWPEYGQSNAFKNLRQVLWDVQQSIGTGWLEIDRENVFLSGKLWLDVQEFESRISKSDANEDASVGIPPLEEAIRLYRNHFLSGFSLKDAHPFNDWAFAKSEELRLKFLDALKKISTDYCALGQMDQAIIHARQLVAFEPLDEAAHRRLMEIYVQAGQTAAALKQYESCEQILRKELNLDPQPETRELFRKIRKGEIKPVQAAAPVQARTPSHNLPHSLATFIGREKQQEEINKLFANRRLVTLVGAGGIGKTSLAVRVGHELLDRYSDGVWFIAFDSLSDGVLIPQTIASIFNIQEGSTGPVSEKLTNFLRTKTTLLIFDNCEHLLDACAQLVASLLSHCPKLNVLVTSREMLNIAGEAVYYLPSLSIPENGVADEELKEYESIRLFVERAALVSPSFRLTEENAQSIVEICRKVDGIPLAIEFAAAHVNILKVQEILKQLQDSFALLSGGGRTILPRRQTIRASLDWDWKLLDESERTFLRRLSVFAGGWTLESAQAVCEGDVLVLISALVKKSLIVVDQQSGRETRYRFHEMVREYVHEKLLEAHDEGMIRTRHLKYFLRLSKQADDALRGPSDLDWMERLNDERNNIRAALRWANQVDTEAGLYLVGNLRRYWESSDLREGIQWLETFLPKPDATDYPHARAIALFAYGWLLTWLQQFATAHSVTEESLELFRAEDDKPGETDALVSLANIDQFLEELDTAVELLRQALGMSKSLKDPWREANVYFYLGWDRRDPQRAMDSWEKAVDLYRKVGDNVSLANLLGVLGQFRVLNGDIESGEQYIDEAMLLWQSNRRANVWENTRIAKSLIALIRGDPDQAYAILEGALQTVKETGNWMSYLWVRVRLGYMALRAGRLDAARDILIETAQDFKKSEYTVGATFALECMACLYVETGQPERAARLLGWADGVRSRVEDRRLALEQADADKVVVNCITQMGEAAFSDAYDEGRNMSLEQAVEYARSGTNPFSANI